MSADGERWFLVNASPDVREQLGRLPSEPRIGARHVPIEGILLSDAELDHSLGVILLRESGSLALYATDGVRHVLENGSHILPMMRAFANVTITTMVPDCPLLLTHRDGSRSGLSVTPFTVQGDAPKFAPDAPGAHTVGLLIADDATGGTLAFVPGCGAIDDRVLARLREAETVLFDGTFWSDDELRSLDISDSTATQMGHVPISGEKGSLAHLAALPSLAVIYTHINNTNPILREDAKERETVLAAGVEIAADGMTLTV